MAPIRQRFDPEKPSVVFEDNVHDGVVTLFRDQTEALRTHLDAEFKKYVEALP